MSNDQLIEQASNGNITPLLDALRKDVPMSGPPAGQLGHDMDMPANTLWFDVQDAVSEGKLSERQFDQCYAAVCEGHKH